MKLRPVTKLDKRNMATSKIFDNDVMLVNCDVIIFIPIYGQFPSIQKPDSRISALILLRKGTIFAKIANFLQEKCRHQQN